MELDSGQVLLSLPTFSQWDSYDLVLRAHSYLQGGFSPDSRYLAFLTPGPLKLDAGGWPVGVDVSQKEQVRINVLDWKARKIVWSETSSPEAVLVWSPDSVHLLYQDQDLNWNLSDFQEGAAAQFTSKWGERINNEQVAWSGNGRYLSLSDQATIRIYDITHGVLPGQPVIIEHILMWDLQNGWGLAAGDQLVHTTDGGRTWEWTGRRAGTFYGRGPQSGWLEMNGSTWETQDSGRSWQSSILKQADLIVQGRTWPASGQAFFLDAQTGWRLDTDGFLQQTQDGGKSWIDLRKVGWAQAQFSFVDQKTGWALVSSEKPQPPALVFTTDGGLTWQELHPFGGE